MKLVVGITGSTGVIYGIRLLEILKRLNIETHLIMSEWAQKCISMETDHDLNSVTGGSIITPRRANFNMFSKLIAVNGVSRTTRINLRDSFNVTPATRATNVSS